MRPMLARTLGPRFDQYPCFVQPKLNGIRALAGQGIFQSRGEKLWKTTFFPHIVEQIASLGLSKHVLDGEFYVHGWRLQRINSAVGVNNNEPNEDTPSIQFHVFDVVDPDRVFSARWFDIYHGILDAQLPNVVAVPTSLIVNSTEMQQHFRQYTGLGYEGIMLRPDGVYEFGEHMANHGQSMTTFRSRSLWKHKAWLDDEFECIGVTQGEGKASIGIGALTCASHATRPGEGRHSTFNVGTGFTDEERIEFSKNPPVGKLIKIRYLELTADGIPYNNSFLAVLS